MIFLLLIFSCGAISESNTGITFNDAGGELEISISPSKLTRELQKQLNLDPNQTHNIERIIMEASAGFEMSQCREDHGQKMLTILRRMDRRIERMLSTRQRVRYDKFKKNRIASITDHKTT